MFLLEIGNICIDKTKEPQVLLSLFAFFSSNGAYTYLTRCKKSWVLQFALLKNLQRKLKKEHETYFSWGCNHGPSLHYKWKNLKLRIDAIQCNEMMTI